MTKDIPELLAEILASKIIDKRLRQVKIGIVIAVIGIICMFAGWWLNSQTAWYYSYPNYFMYRPYEDSGVFLMLLGSIGINVGFFVAYLNKRKAA